MIIKYCYKDEIHKVFTPPSSYDKLQQEIKDIFVNNLPSVFSLQYRDIDGDFITISSDSEYVSMLRYDLPKSKKSVKIYIVPTFQKAEARKAKEISQMRASEESFEVIEDRNGNVIEVSVNELSLSSDKSKGEEVSRATTERKISTRQDLVHFNEEDTPPIDLECSMNSHNETIDMIEARVSASKKSRHRAHDLEDDYDSCNEQDQMDNSLEKILTNIRHSGFKTNSNAKFFPPEDYSLENSNLSKEIDEVAQELANIRFRNIIRRLQSLRSLNNEENSGENSASDESVDLKHIKPIIFDSMELIRKSQLQIQNEAARTIQSSFRNFKIRKLIQIIQQTEASPEIKTEVGKKRKQSQLSQSDCYLCEDFEYCEHTDESKAFQDFHMKKKTDSETNFETEKNSPLFKMDQTSDNQLISDTKEVNNYRYQLYSPKESSFISLGSDETRKTVFKTAYVMNTGDKIWRKCYIKSIGPLFGETCEIYNVEVGQLVLITLQFNGNFGVGHYSTQWKIIHENSYGMTEVVGEPFNIEFTIVSKGDIFSELKNNLETRVEKENTPLEMHQDQGEMSFSEEKEAQEDEYETDFRSNQNEDDEEEEEEEEEEDDDDDEGNDEEQDQENDLTFAKYGDSLEEIAKVKRLSILFPSDPWDEIFDFVAARSEISINDLLMAYLDYRNGN